MKIQEIQSKQVQIMSDIKYILTHYRDKTFIPFDWLNKLIEMDYGYHNNILIQTPGYKYESIDMYNIPLEDMVVHFKIFVIDALDEIYKLTIAIRDNKVVDYWMVLDEYELK